MRTEQLILRCYAEKERDGLWVAVCLDLSLAAQGKSMKQARERLHDQIGEYVFDALAGEDKAHSTVLLNRKAPLSQVTRYHLLKALSKAHMTLKSLQGKSFLETLPLQPAH